MLWGMERRTGVNAMLTELVSEQNVGKGELAAMLGNLKASTLVVAPLLYSSLYSWAKKTDRPATAPFTFAALTVVAAEALHLSVPNTALDVGNKSNTPQSNQ